MRMLALLLLLAGTVTQAPTARCGFLAVAAPEHDVATAATHASGAHHGGSAPSDEAEHDALPHASCTHPISCAVLALPALAAAPALVAPVAARDVDAPPSLPRSPVGSADPPPPRQLLI